MNVRSEAFGPSILDLTGKTKIYNATFLCIVCHIFSIDDMDLIRRKVHHKSFNKSINPAGSLMLFNIRQPPAKCSINVSIIVTQIQVV